MAAEEPTPPLRPMTGGAVMGTASRFTVAITGAATTIFVARLLGPEGTGGFAIALTLVLLLTVACSLGIEHGIAYYVASGRWAPRDAMRVALRVALLSGAAGAAMCVAARLAMPSAFGGLAVGSTVVAALALPFALTWFYVSFVGLAIDRYEAYVLPPALQSGSAMVLVIGLALIADLPGAVVGMTIAHVLVAIASVVWARRRLPARGTQPQEPRQLRRALSFGAKGYGANALAMLSTRVDLLVLSAAASAAAVGHYAIAIAVTAVLWLVPSALSDVLFPRIAALSASGDDEHRAFVEDKSLRHTVLLVLLALPVMVGPLLLLVVPIYGPAFEPAIELALILLPGIALTGVAGVLSSTIVGRGRPEYSLYTALIVTPLTLTAYALLIPALDARGAALAKSLSYTLTFALSVYFYRRVTGAGAIAQFVPTRVELRELRSVAPQIRQWLIGMWRRARPDRA
ncbi:MAG TPA: oligosaccharide flippase family protein [Solirubrobacteraceae bacterium]|nr:oligosaccharide flippase family protein [Solirubrobacteraceae bacterium]